ncbi:serine hydrolase domain-containing protein [Massilia niabensis]|uniref:Serine hydrolase domain-containing protein n=1 Tax=Massilia niabensis TaxID=544910 RepID=A0ABW0L1W8_9BURK
MHRFSLRALRLLKDANTAAIAGAGLALLAAGCAGVPQPRSGDAGAYTELDSSQFARIDAAIGAAIAQQQMPGAVFHLERGGARYERAYGRFTHEPGAPGVTLDTVFDAASLSKVLATAPSILLLLEDGKLDLEGKLAAYFPECAGGGKDAITIRQLLTHTSGLGAGLPARTNGTGAAWSGDAAAFALACAQPLKHAPGSFFTYSDINYVLLGQLVRRVSGMPIDEFARQRIFLPLGMKHTGYLPLRRLPAQRIAPTQRAPAAGPIAPHGDLAGGATLQGVVHDPTVRRMGGVAGSAGVFSTVHDIARFARMLLGEGELDGTRVLSRASVRLLGTVQTPPGMAALRGLGMDIDSPFALRPRGALFPVGSYGHTGFTGCVLWIDPASRSFYVFLSNRVYPDDKGNVLPLYTELGTLAAQAARVAADPSKQPVASR